MEPDDLSPRDAMFYSLSIKSSQVWIEREKVYLMSQKVLDSQWNSFPASINIFSNLSLVSPGNINLRQNMKQIRIILCVVLETFRNPSRPGHSRMECKHLRPPWGGGGGEPAGLKCQFVQTADYDVHSRPTDARILLRRRGRKFPLSLSLFASLAGWTVLRDLLFAAAAEETT